MEGLIKYLNAQKARSSARWLWKRVVRDMFAAFVVQYNLNAPWEIGQDMAAAGGDMNAMEVDSTEWLFSDIVSGIVDYYAIAYSLVLTRADIANVLAEIGNCIVEDYPQPV